MAWTAIIKPIASALFETLVDWFKSWYEQERREAAEWSAKAREHQMDSMKEGIALERKLKEEMVKPVEVVSLEEWNKEAKERNEKNRVVATTLPVLLFCLFLLSGCFRFFTAAPEYKPEIPAPPIPELSSTAPINNSDFQKLLIHIKKLHNVLDVYNEAARKSNIENGYTKPPNE